MSKYPCGICTIGVRHKGILCTGGCNKWHHAKCLNWTDKKFKNLSKTEIESWQCSGCYNKTQGTAKIDDLTQIHTTNKENTSQTPTMEEINSKLLNYNIEDIDLETSLTLAAEVGNTLLVENTILKEKINKLTLTNSNLALKIQNLEKQNLTYLEEQNEELLSEKQILINTNNTLVERLNEAEKQLNKEKHYRNELVSSFEEHDNDKENIIMKLEQDNQTLRNEIKSLKQDLLKTQSQNTKHYKNMETQTVPKEENEHNNNSCLIKMLAEIKMKQENMELSLKTLINYVSQQHLRNNVKTPITPTNGKNTRIHNKYNNESAKLTKGECQKTAYKNSKYSVSLQVAKCHQRSMTTDVNTIAPYRRDGDCLVGKTLHKPIQNNGRKKMPPTYPEFVDLQVNTTIETQPNCVKTLDTPTPLLSPQRNHHFLVKRCQPKERHKPQPQFLPRIFWNSTISKNTKLKLHTKT